MKKVVIVGGGFAGISCARHLLKTCQVHITLIDKNNYHKFTPLLYQVATCALSQDAVATSIRYTFENNPNIDVKMAHAISCDPKKLLVTTEEGKSYQGDALVLAAGACVNFFETKGAKEFSFPLYGLVDAERLRSRIIAAFEAADLNPSLIDVGALNFVIVGAGPTGVEIAGAIADMLASGFPKEFSDLSLKSAEVHLIDHANAPLSPFSKESQNYAAKTLSSRGVKLHMGLTVKEVSEDFVLLSNGEKILSKIIIWAGGLQAVSLAKHSQLTTGRGGRINVNADLTCNESSNIYVVGDLANIPSQEGVILPQLASVAKQSGKWAAMNILLSFSEKPKKPFIYKDKGIMAMLGRNAAILEAGKKRRKITGFFAYLAWLGVHAALLETMQQKIQAILEWAWNYFSRTPSLQILDRTDSSKISVNDKAK